MSVPELMQKLFDKIDGNRNRYIENLRKAVAIKSVSAWPHTRSEIVKMIHWTGDLLQELGATVEYVGT